MVKAYYYWEAPLKPGVKEALQKLQKKGVGITAATSGNREHIEAAFQRLGIGGYFQKIFTSSEVGVGKSNPLIYQEAAKFLGTELEETYVFEDVLYAIETAKKAGFHTVGIYDQYSARDTEKSNRKQNSILRAWSTLPKFWRTCKTGNLAADWGHHLASPKKINAQWKRRKNMRTALTIAGSDSSGGAGIQADIKTMITNGVYAMSAITALTAQNTTGVMDIMEVTPEFLGKQLDMIFTDIYPDAVKIGMVANSELIEKIAEKLKEYKVSKLVVDPVMVATSGSRLISEDAVAALKEHLLPLAMLLTPNIPETEVLSGIRIRTEEDMIAAAKSISEQYGCGVLCKGGHSFQDANDLLYNNGSYQWFYGKRIDNPNTHGTGCTLSSAIAANLAKGFSLEESVKRAKEYLSGALADMLDLGKGSGPMNHGFAVTGEFAGEKECWL